ncbi:HAD-IIB family hydrolase [Jannaschia sp. Os4]|uniref:HAD-IIB family hydrolase n=1 Tax=Jannaschia sp. Os4 TaxID=2807617 RepID=UPI00193AC697|nr:HAD-IIB family hydrolase [Jannaschia sp. Os4]MBM2576018.1 HAD-IIB family hydrolase [Jannaschia sp. Os4]
MYVMHVALGGCLKAPPIRLGVTEDTGGHIAYVLGAAAAQARRGDVARIDIVTRAFSDPALDSAHARAVEPVDGVTRIRRIAGGGPGYLDKDDLEAALPDLRASFLRMLARGPRPDAIHAHFADAAELALAARDRWGIPVIYTPHSLGIDKRGCMGADPALARRIARERDAIARADAVVVSSRDEAERQVTAYGTDAEGRTHRASPGVWMAERDGTAGAEALLARFLRDPGKPLILTIARPVAKKNLPALVEAYATTPGLRERANLAIVAGLRDGPESGGAEQRATLRALMEGMDRYDLYGRLALPQRHVASDVPQLYRLAARSGGVFVNPALHEPFGLTLLEAATHRLPVVATDRGGPRDILSDIGHGVLVDPTDVRAMGEAIRAVVSDPARHAAHAAAAERNLSRYSWDDYATRTTSIYAKLAEAPRRPAGRPHRGARRLLVSDIDGTLTGSRAGARRLRRWLASAGMPWAVATGRSLTEARRILARWDLPEPDAFVTAVGTELHLPDVGGRATLDETYAARISQGWDAEAARTALSGAGATFQDEVEQRRWKLGLTGDRVEAVRVVRVLRNAGVDATVIHSHENLIDVLAPRADKASAMARVAEIWGLSVNDCIACGDSGNDASMLRAAGAAILVGNALPELDLPPRPGLIRAVAPYADGVLEGLASLGLAAAPAAAVPARRVAFAPAVRP